jgi:hypothetical protein
VNCTEAFYQLLLDHADSSTKVEELILGLTWTFCRSETGIGLAMSPGQPCRTLPWAGTLRGRTVKELATWIQHTDPFESSIGMAAINSVINDESELVARAKPLAGQWPGNLAVFEHFLPQLRDQRIAVIGRYPGMDTYLSGLNVTVLELNPSPNDLPAHAAETVLPEVQWVFLTASSIINKTFPRLTELAQDATVVLMGPTVPWLRELVEFNIDYLAGVIIQDGNKLRQTIAEGGGTKIFEGGVRYAVVEL